jgi:ferric-dicitrate binding protein FerR (iron transport regulator)
MTGQERTTNEPLTPAASSKASSRGRGWIKWLLAAAIVGGVMYACRGEKTYDWEEEVVLSSGERLVLERSVRLERISAPFNPFKSEWAWRESTIVVRDGPADLLSFS